MRTNERRQALDCLEIIEGMFKKQCMAHYGTLQVLVDKAQVRADELRPIGDEDNWDVGEHYAYLDAIDALLALEQVQRKFKYADLITLLGDTRYTKEAENLLKG